MSQEPVYNIIVKHSNLEDILTHEISSRLFSNSSSSVESCLDKKAFSKIFLIDMTYEEKCRAICRIDKEWHRHSDRLKKLGLQRNRLAHSNILGRHSSKKARLDILCSVAKALAENSGSKRTSEVGGVIDNATREELDRIIASYNTTYDNEGFQELLEQAEKRLIDEIIKESGEQ